VNVRRASVTSPSLLVLALLLAASAPPWPDDWDGLGFLASVGRFDLDRFAPHPPGYPVYVALLKMAALLAPSPIAAADVVAVVSGVVSVGLLAASARRVSVSVHALGVGAFVAACPLLWRAASGVGSEAPALALSGLALWGASERTRRGATLLGVAVGLGLGVRASWAPLYLPMLALAPSGTRGRALGASAVATCGWVVPMLALVGPRHYATLLGAHLSGHALRWGGTALTQPARALYLARDVLVDGLGAGGDGLGLSIGALGAIVGLLGLLAWRTARWRGARVVALLLVPYLVWVALGQNLREQPRHVLPLVVALAVGLALAAFADRRARAPAALLVVLMATRTAIDARARRAIPPPGAQLVALVRSLPDPAQVAVFGVASVRFFEPTELAGSAYASQSLGDALVVLAHMDSLPARMLVTGEVEGLDPSPYPTEPLATFCRPPRIDRRAPCLDVYEVRPPFLRAR
jgi:hypothetical protein